MGISSSLQLSGFSCSETMGSFQDSGSLRRLCFEFAVATVADSFLFLLLLMLGMVFVRDKPVVVVLEAAATADTAEALSRTGDADTPGSPLSLAAAGCSWRFREQGFRDDGLDFDEDELFLRVMFARRSRRPLRKEGCFHVLPSTLQWLQRRGEINRKPQLLSCRSKLRSVVCPKWAGKTQEANEAWWWTTKAVPSAVHETIPEDLASAEAPARRS